MRQKISSQECVNARSYYASALSRAVTYYYRRPMLFVFRDDISISTLNWKHYRLRGFIGARRSGIV